MQHTGGPYLWATEFENVHTLWSYREPCINVAGIWYTCLESYYHAQKPHPYDDAQWRKQRVQVMRKGVRAKVAADPQLRALLLSTHPHPLLALKGDRFWGFDAKRGGETC